MAHRCNIADCKEEATHEVIYVLRTSEDDQQPSYTTPIARVCPFHSEVNVWAAFWNRKQWDQIVMAMEGMGRKKPSTGYSIMKSQIIGTSKNNSILV